MDFASQKRKGEGIMEDKNDEYSAAKQNRQVGIGCSVALGLFVIIMIIVMISL